MLTKKRDFVDTCLEPRVRDPWGNNHVIMWGPAVVIWVINEGAWRVWPGTRERPNIWSKQAGPLWVLREKPIRKPKKESNLNTATHITQSKQTHL